MISIDKDLFLPEELRGELKKPFGRVGSCPELIDSLDKSGRLVVVGDFVAIAFIKAGAYPNVIVWDGTTERKPIVRDSLELLSNYAPARSVKNPAGSITKEAWSAISELLNKDRASLFVDGEEDLLTIPAVLNSDDGTQVVYGSPGEGAILIDVNRKIKSAFQDILSRFK